MLEQQNTDLHLLPAEEYVADLKSELSTAQEARILTFHISAQNMMEALLPELHGILERGGNVELLADAEFGKHNLTEKVWLALCSRELREKNQEIKARTSEMYADLESRGATVKFTNERRGLLKRILPVFKSDHRKIVTLTRENGERVGYFGGTNLNEGGKNDFMVKTAEQQVAETLHEVSKKFDKTLPERNVSQSLRENTLLALLDVGRPFDSVIMDEAGKMIDESKERLVYVTQIPPELGLLRTFIKAERAGKNVRIILPDEKHPNISGFPYGIVLALGKALLRLSGSKIKYEHLNQFTHAKILIADDTVIVGSHNLSAVGVISGITEFSMKIRIGVF